MSPQKPCINPDSANKDPAGAFLASSANSEKSSVSQRLPVPPLCTQCSPSVLCSGDRGHPSCGWCNRNGQICEYKERKKPGLRAGYGRELEARLGKLSALDPYHLCCTYQQQDQIDSSQSYSPSRIVSTNLSAPLHTPSKLLPRPTYLQVLPACMLPTTALSLKYN